MPASRVDKRLQALLLNKWRIDWLSGLAKLLPTDQSHSFNPAARLTRPDMLFRSLCYIPRLGIRGFWPGQRVNSRQVSTRKDIGHDAPFQADASIKKQSLGQDRQIIGQSDNLFTRRNVVYITLELFTRPPK